MIPAAEPKRPVQIMTTTRGVRFETSLTTVEAFELVVATPPNRFAQDLIRQSRRGLSIPQWTWIFFFAERIRAGKS